MCVRFHMLGTVYNYNICGGGGGYDSPYPHNAHYLPILLYYAIGGQVNHIQYHVALTRYY